jgi:hypothetical protein
MSCATARPAPGSASSPERHAAFGVLMAGVPETVVRCPQTRWMRSMANRGEGCATVARGGQESLNNDRTTLKS